MCLHLDNLIKLLREDGILGNIAEYNDYIQIFNKFEILIVIVEEYRNYFDSILPLLEDSNFEKLLSKYSNLNILFYHHLKNDDYNRFFQIISKYLDVEIMNLSIKDNDEFLLITCLSSNIVPNKETYKLLFEHNLFSKMSNICLINENIIDYYSIVIDFIEEDKEDLALLIIECYSFNLKDKLTEIFNYSLSWYRPKIIDHIWNKHNVTVDFSIIDNSSAIRHLQSIMV